MIEITGGNKYMDIDAYASCIAYAKLLNSLNIKAKAVTTAKSNNQSVPPSFREMKYKLEEPLLEKDKAIILDICDPRKINKDILNSNIIEVIDHHPYKAHEKYWLEKGISLRIEEIGAICTIIFEKIEAENKLEILDGDLCKLLIAGIIDNTLNLKANITKERDIIAYKKLLKIGNIPSSFANKYLLECQEYIESNIEKSIEEDLKTNINIASLPNYFGQLLIVDINSILNKKQKIINYMNNYNDDWIVNIICLKDGKSYILGSNKRTLKRIVKNIDGVITDDKILILNKFLLRKEIMKRCQN